MNSKKWQKSLFIQWKTFKVCLFDKSLLYIWTRLFNITPLVCLTKLTPLVSLHVFHRKNKHTKLIFLHNNFLYVTSMLSNYKTFPLINNYHMIQKKKIIQNRKLKKKSTCQELPKKYLKGGKSVECNHLHVLKVKKIKIHHY